MPDSGEMCLSTNTADGQPCQNLKRSCPHEAHRQPNRSASKRNTAPLRSDIDTDKLLQAVKTVGGSVSPSSSLVEGFLDSGTEVGLPTQPEEFNQAVALLQREHPQLAVEMLVRDTHLVNGLWCLADKYPDGKVFVHPPAKRDRVPPPREVGTYVFVGGTALVCGHGIGERISDDLDMLFIPHVDYTSSSAIRNNSKRIGRAVVPGIAGRHNVTAFGQTTVRCEYPLADRDVFIKMDVVPQRSYNDHLDLLGVETHPIVSLAGRHASEEQLARHPQLGGFELPLLHPAYTATTKFDALHHRAQRGTAGTLRGIFGRARDIYDLYSIATSDRADEVRERVAALAEITVHDFTNRGEHPRPAGGYANSPVFQAGTPSYESLRQGAETLLPLIVWGHLPSFKVMVDAARSLDPR